MVSGFRIGIVLIGFLAGFLFWTIVHISAIPLAKFASRYFPSKYHCIDLEHLQNRHKLYNFSRLVRSTIYCSISSAFGLYIICNTYVSWPDDPLLKFGPIEFFVCEMALSHWTLSIVEDHMVGDEIYRSASETKNSGYFVFFYGGLLSHHMFAMFAYAWTLCTFELSGLSVFGLIFEMPVILLNAREIYISFCPQNTPWCKRDVIRFWVALHILWHGTRTLACLLYLTSLAVWLQKIKILVNASSFVVYNVLGAGFVYTNTVLLLTVVPLYMIADRNRTHQRNSDHAQDIPSVTANML